MNGTKYEVLHCEALSIPPFHPFSFQIALAKLHYTESSISHILFVCYISAICMFLLQSYRFASVDEYICVAEHLPDTYNLAKSELIESSTFTLMGQVNHINPTDLVAEPEVVSSTVIEDGKVENDSEDDVDIDDPDIDTSEHQTVLHNSQNQTEDISIKSVTSSEGENEKNELFESEKEDDKLDDLNKEITGVNPDTGVFKSEGDAVEIPGASDVNLEEDGQKLSACEAVVKAGEEVSQPIPPKGKFKFHSILGYDVSVILGAALTDEQQRDFIVGYR